MDTHYDIARLPEVGSTQDVAAAAARERGRPVLVVADRQSAGRGRQGRTWLEPDHGLFSSYAFGCDWPAHEVPLLALCTAVAVGRAVEALADVDVGYKWPNDLMIDERKVGGILAHTSEGLVTIGCGINLTWADPPGFATALLSSPPATDLAPRLAIGWVDRLRDIVAAGADAWPRAAYADACVTIGRHVRWESGSGTATGITGDGSLVVDGPEGRTEVLSGDVHLLSHN
jgi:BirA family biotin operon repressor/biotin-[acetyl-CoA-carboxylase] ligase